MGILLFAGGEKTGFIGLHEGAGNGVGMEGRGEGVRGVEMVEKVGCSVGDWGGFRPVIDGF